MAKAIVLGGGKGAGRVVRFGEGEGYAIENVISHNLESEANLRYAIRDIARIASITGFAPLKKVISKQKGTISTQTQPQPSSGSSDSGNSPDSDGIEMLGEYAQ